MAKLDERPSPPGSYPVVVLGSGAGGLQVSYYLRRHGVGHALLSADDAPAGMFRRFPFFQRLISWTKPYAPKERGTREYEWYDWNSLLAEEPEARAIMPELMSGTSYFPTRDEMERNLATFAGRTGLTVRYGCRWEGTRLDGDGFAVATSDGEYRCAVVVVAVGMTQPWKPDIPGLERVPHYVETRDPREYSGARVVVIGKRNSGFEIADGLLPWARQIILVSPRPRRLSLESHSTAGARARYMQPYEDYVFGGGTFVLDAAIDRVERTSKGYRVLATGTTVPGDWALEADEVIAATGFTTPLGDLRALGVATFYQDRLPAQTPFWESAAVPGIYFAGSITQGSVGLRKYGVPSTSAAVHGFRYNARVLAAHLAGRLLGRAPPRHELRPDEVVPFLLTEATEAPELLNQKSYLARVVSFEERGGRILDEGVLPLAHFVDDAGPDAVAAAVEITGDGEIRPAFYVRREGRVEEHVLASDPMLDFRTPDHRVQLMAILKAFLE